MISKGQIANMIRGKPIGSHFKIGSFPPGAAFGPYPGLFESYFAFPHDVKVGKLSPGPCPPPPGANCQTPERSRALKEDCAPCAQPNGERVSVARMKTVQHNRFRMSSNSVRSVFYANFTRGQALVYQLYVPDPEFIKS